MFLRPYVKYYHKIRYEEELDLFCSSIRANISIKLHKKMYEINSTLLLRTHFKLTSYIYIYTLTGHFIRYTLQVLGWAFFCLQNRLNSLWHRFNKGLETFLRDFGPYWHDSIMQFLFFKYSDQPVWHQQPFHVQSHSNPLSQVLFI